MQINVHVRQDTNNKPIAESFQEPDRHYHWAKAYQLLSQKDHAYRHENIPSDDIYREPLYCKAVLLLKPKVNHVKFPPPATQIYKIS